MESMICCSLCTGVLSMVCGFFFFKQKTAYEMRISDWSSDVCSSDLLLLPLAACAQGAAQGGDASAQGSAAVEVAEQDFDAWLAGEIGRASCRERVCQYV